MGAQKVTITIAENQGKVYGGTGISIWSWKLGRISLGGEHRKGFSRKDVQKSTGGHMRQEVLTQACTQTQSVSLLLKQILVLVEIT